MKDLFFKDKQNKGSDKKESIIIKIDIDANEVIKSVEATRDRKRRLKKNPPRDLPADAIKTLSVRKTENPNSLSKYPVFYLTGQAGDDTLEAFINSNPSARIISFYVNGPADDFQPGRNVASPIYNIVTGDFRIVFEENNFMATAIKQWLRNEYDRIRLESKARGRRLGVETDKGSSC